MENYDLRDALRELATILAHYPPLADTTLALQEEGEDLAIIELTGEDLFIEVRLEEEEVGLTKMLRCSPVFVPGYYKHYPSTMQSPPEVEEMYLLPCASILQAVIQLVGQEFYWRVGGILEAEAEVKEIEEADRYARAWLEEGLRS